MLINPLMKQVYTIESLNQSEKSRFIQ